MAELTGSIFEFRLPDVGEGLEDAEIVQWKVSVGQEIDVNQAIVEIETAKALVELPSPFAGTVLELLAPEGSLVHVGAPIIRIQLIAPQVADATQSIAKRTEILVGSGPRNEEGDRRGRAPRNYGGNSPSQTLNRSIPVVPTVTVTQSTNRIIALAKPPVRKLAKDCGVDLTILIGSGPEGSITRNDVQLAAKNLSNESSVIRSNADPSRESRTPIHGVQKVMADAMVASAFTAPHVTEFISVDMSDAMNLLGQLRSQPDFAGIRISPLSLLARAMCLAVRQTPQVNSFWDARAQEIVTKHYVNLGIATATDRGLLVPNVKDAAALNFKDLAKAIEEVVDAARSKRAQLSQLSGGTMSITNIGVFGIDTGTPILPPGESAIICLGAIVDRPWVVGKEILIRQVTTLSLSFDHRLVDGAQGSKFLADIAQLLREPLQLIEQ